MMKIQTYNKYIKFVLIIVFLCLTLMIYPSYASEAEVVCATDTDKTIYTKELQELEKTINGLYNGDLSFDDLLSDDLMYKLTEVENPAEKIPLSTRIKEAATNLLYQFYLFLTNFVTKNLIYIIITIALILFKVINKKRGDKKTWQLDRKMREM